MRANPRSTFVARETLWVTNRKQNEDLKGHSSCLSLKHPSSRKKVALEGRRTDVLLALTFAGVGAPFIALWLSGRCLVTEMIILPIYTNSTHNI